MRCLPVLLATVSVSVAAGASLADAGSTFATNPLTDVGNLIQGPDAGNAGTRFTHNAGDGTLTAHYNTASPTVKLLFPLGQHFTQETSFAVAARFKLLSAGLTIPADFGGSVPAFGLANSVTTGSVRASTSDANFNEVTQGDAYDLVTFDYYPTQDNTFGGNSINLSTVQSALSGQSFNQRFHFTFSGFTNQSLPLDQFIDLAINYDSGTKKAAVNWGSGSLNVDLSGAVFDVDAFTIALWNDPNLTAQLPAVAAGSPAGGDVVFDSFSVVATPEPASLALLSLGSLLLVRRRR